MPAKIVYRRPSDFETAVQLLKALDSADAVGDSIVLRVCVQRLFAIDWFEDAMRPLYEANAVVKMVMNSLVPMIQELIVEPDVLRAAKQNTAEGKQAKRRTEYEVMRLKLLEGCAASKARTVTPRFAKMRDAMERYASDADVQAALALLYSTMKTGRIALRLVTERISASLEKDCDIETSTDLPTEVFSLA